MRYGIPLLGNRVAPRCTYADSVLMIVHRRNKISTEDNVLFNCHSLFDLRELLSEYHVDTLICGGISQENKEFLKARQVEIIDNVACTIDEIIDALKNSDICPGFGLNNKDNSGSSISKRNDTSSGDISTGGIQIDCLTCMERLCTRGKPCPASLKLLASQPAQKNDISRILEATLDITCEKERTLCRLSELVYFCLEMRYKRLGIAYCVDLQEPAEILTQVLRRFFKVYPVCCKIGGIDINDPYNPQMVDISKDKHKKQIACNPQGQAEVLNRLETDFNIIVGICMGADCVFTKASEAPVTTLFVKDRSLANNPIGALYSDYYLNEAKKALVTRNIN